MSESASLFSLKVGDCVSVLRDMPADSVDSIVTDPPYGLGFMGKKWDVGVPAVDVFAECLRVLKPGGHLLAFGGSRTYHRLAVAVEDAGFEIRDQIMWVYGSGFPKSQNVSKAIDKAAGAERTEVRGVKAGHESFAGRGTSGVKRDAGSQGGEGGFHRPWMEDEARANQYHLDMAPATDAARQWDGWGTALKPAHEPIVVARKPLAGTVAANVLEHGTGALNIDGCRVGFSDGEESPAASRRKGAINHLSDRPAAEAEAEGRLENRSSPERYQQERPGEALGRWPANLIHDGSDEVLAAFPDAKGQQGALTGDEPSGVLGHANCYGRMDQRHAATPRIDSSTSAARFFYCAKASKKDRNEGLGAMPETTADPYGQHRGRRMAENDARFDGKPPSRGQNNHPTVKPTELMRYLCRLVTPPRGLVLDPFAGSGSTGKAAILEGFRFIGIEIDDGYAEIARTRLRHAQSTCVQPRLL